MNNEIREALEKLSQSSPSPWRYAEPTTNTDLLDANGGYVIEGDVFGQFEGILIANAPVWLHDQQQTIELQALEITRLRKALEKERDAALVWDGIVRLIELTTSSKERVRPCACAIDRQQYLAL